MEVHKIPMRPVLIYEGETICLTNKDIERVKVIGRTIIRRIEIRREVQNPYYNRNK